MVFDDVFEHDGVLVCVCRAFVEHVAALDVVVDQAGVDHVQDLVIAMSLAAATFLAITAVNKIPPIRLWSVGLAVAIAAASRTARRRYAANQRVQRATAAVSATAIGFGNLLIAFIVIDLIWSRYSAPVAIRPTGARHLPSDVLPGDRCPAADGVQNADSAVQNEKEWLEVGP
jgi:hypothetical protein